MKSKKIIFDSALDQLVTLVRAGSEVWWRPRPDCCGGPNREREMDALDTD